jgi:hypothetical protein
VNGDGFVSPIDVLILINYLNANPGGKLPDELFPDDPPYPPSVPYYDVLGNGIVIPLDVLEVINYLNSAASSPGGEGEAAASVAALPGSGQTDAGSLLVVADYSLTAGTVPTIDMGLQPAEDQVSDTTIDRSRDWNTAPVSSSREAEFALLARQSDSVVDQVLDDLLGDIASDVDGSRTAASAADWILGRLV